MNTRLRKSIKFTVSIPWKEYEEMEAVRKKAGVTRSAFIQETISTWKAARRRESAIKAYVSGYRETPEDPALAEALAKAAAEILPVEDWT
jgi:metal-responsive CopG/Arc/MetJ family transcriptional regulator